MTGKRSSETRPSATVDEVEAWPHYDSNKKRLSEVMYRTDRIVAECTEAVGDPNMTEDVKKALRDVVKIGKSMLKEWKKEGHGRIADWQ